MSIALIIVGLAVIFVILVLFKAIRIIPEYQRIVVFRLGRLLGDEGPGPRAS